MADFRCEMGRLSADAECDWSLEGMRADIADRYVRSTSRQSLGGLQWRLAPGRTLRLIYAGLYSDLIRSNLGAVLVWSDLKLV